MTHPTPEEIQAAMRDAVSEQTRDAEFQYETSQSVAQVPDLFRLVRQQPAFFTNEMMFALGMSLGIRIGEKRHS